jgi:hypothetical protein
MYVSNNWFRKIITYENLAVWVEIYNWPLEIELISKPKVFKAQVWTIWSSDVLTAMTKKP